MIVVTNIVYHLPMRLTILDYGLFQVHENARVIGLVGYLIQPNPHTHILVDTGFPAWYPHDLAAAAQRDNLGTFGRILHMTHDNTPAGQLAKVGLTPADITHLVITHTHIDHVGGIGDFPNAPIYISQAERDLPQPLYFGGRSSVQWPSGRQWHTLTDDVTLCEGVTLLSTPGHSVGHYSLLLQLPNTGPVILAADAINRAEEWENDAFPNALARASAQRLMALSQQQQALLIYGHDPAQWGQLRKAPAFYD